MQCFQWNTRKHHLSVEILYQRHNNNDSAVKIIVNFEIKRNSNSILNHSVRDPEYRIAN